jgi:hypothetical protein
MRFKTTDLLVTVLPKLELNKDALKVCLLHTMICKHPTFGCQQCSIFASCAHCSVAASCRGCSIAVSVCSGCSLVVSCAGCTVAISGGCHGCSVLASIGCGFGNSCGGSNCDPTFVGCFGGSRDPLIIEHLEDLVTLKAELQDTLKQLDVIQKEGLPSAIGSKAEAEAMEKSLTEALEQVRAAKKGIK